MYAGGRPTAHARRRVLARGLLVGVCSLPTLSKYQGSNSGCQAWGQAPLLPESLPSGPDFVLFLKHGCWFSNSTPHIYGTSTQLTE